jgi:hypothetical protein
MIIAQRILKISYGGRQLDVPIRIYLPTHEGDHWQCDYEIVWPDRTRRHTARGHDSLQSLLLAMQMAGAEIYASEAHRSGKLTSERPDEGYGFPSFG